MIRELKLKDAPFMLEWMHDESVVSGLQADFASKKLDDCERFIEKSHIEQSSLHMAIVNSNDEYLGTVSLKNISDKSAEFAIAIRSCAMGKGISRQAMKDILSLGIQEKGLDTIYWCVSPENIRAVRFYDKNGYRRVSPNVLHITGGYNDKQIQKYYWYCFTRDDEENMKT